jgi:hypothetical protein
MMMLFVAVPESGDGKKRPTRMSVSIRRSLSNSSEPGAHRRGRQRHSRRHCNGISTRTRRVARRRKADTNEPCWTQNPKYKEAAQPRPYCDRCSRGSNRFPIDRLLAEIRYSAGELGRMRHRHLGRDDLTAIPRASAVLLPFDSIKGDRLGEPLENTGPISATRNRSPICSLTAPETNDACHKAGQFYTDSTSVSAVASAAKIVLSLRQPTSSRAR